MNAFPCYSTQSGFFFCATRCAPHSRDTRGQAPSVSAPIEFSSLVDRERPHVHYECGEGGEEIAPHGAEAGSGNFGELAEPPQGKDVEVTLDTGMLVRLQAEGIACVKAQGGEEQGVLFTTRRCGEIKRKK